MKSLPPIILGFPINKKVSHTGSAGGAGEANQMCMTAVQSGLKWELGFREIARKPRATHICL